MIKSFTIRNPQVKFLSTRQRWSFYRFWKYPVQWASVTDGYVKIDSVEAKTCQWEAVVKQTKEKVYNSSCRYYIQLFVVK